MNTRPLIVIESPYAGDVEANVAYAKRCVHDCLAREENPYASHLFFTQPGLLDDSNEVERALGIECGLGWAAAAPMHAVYFDLGITDGMKKGIRRALANRKRVEFRLLDRELTPDDSITMLHVVQECIREPEVGTALIGPTQRRPSQVHDVKCWPEFFALLVTGDKRFEVRKNDRDYQAGDLITLREWHPAHQAFTGRSLTFVITYVLHGGQFGIDAEACVLSLGSEIAP